MKKYQHFKNSKCKIISLLNTGNEDTIKRAREQFSKYLYWKVNIIERLYRSFLGTLSREAIQWDRRVGDKNIFCAWILRLNGKDG